MTHRRHGLGSDPNIAVTTSMTPAGGEAAAAASSSSSSRTVCGKDHFVHIQVRGEVVRAITPRHARAGAGRPAR